MNASELSVGDWVRSYALNGTKMIKVQSIEVEDEDTFIYENNGIYHQLCNLNPIELSEYMLELNGFTKRGEGDYYLHVDGGSLGVFFVTDFITKVSFLNNHFQWSDIYLYGAVQVHQLQHVLRVFGLFELAENFNVE